MDDREYRERLAHEATTWRRDGLISKAQEHAILARIGADEPKAIGALRLGWLVTAVAVVGAIVLSAGIVLLFASNWDQMPDAFRTGALLTGTLLAYGSGYALIYRSDMQRIGSALLLLGALLYEASVFLVAQIYNMPVDSPVLWLLAAVGTFPLAYLFESRIILLLGIANATAWVVAEMVHRYPDSPETQAALIVVGVAGVVLYAIGPLHAGRRSIERFGAVYAFTGILVLLGLVYVFTFDEVWRDVIDSTQPYAAPSEVYISIGLAALIVGGTWWQARRDIERTIEAAAQAGLLALAAIVATWPTWTGYALIFNAVYFAVACALVARGYLRADERYVNAGLAALALGLLTRYVDVFWSQLAGSAFFIVGGLLLFAIAFSIERFRRSLLRDFEHRAPHPDAGAKGAPA